MSMIVTAAGRKWGGGRGRSRGDRCRVTTGDGNDGDDGPSAVRRYLPSPVVTRRYLSSDLIRFQRPYTGSTSPPVVPARPFLPA